MLTLGEDKTPAEVPLKMVPPPDWVSAWIRLVGRCPLTVGPKTYFAIRDLQQK